MSLYIYKMRKTTKRGKFRKKRNKTRRQRGGADSDFTHLLDRDYIDKQARDNEVFLKNNLVGDKKMVSVTDSMNGSSGSAHQNWFATALFYSAMVSLEVKVYDNDANEKKLLYWIRKNFFPNKRRMFSKITDIKLELVTASVLMPGYHFNDKIDETTGEYIVKGHWVS